MYIKAKIRVVKINTVCYEHISLFNEKISVIYFTLIREPKTPWKSYIIFEERRAVQDVTVND